MHNRIPATAATDTMLGYCTNVHAGATYEQMLANLQRYALPVKQRLSPDAPMGLGLWLPASAARGLVEQDRIAELRDWLGAHGLAVFTLNGFPHGNFHQPVVKHRVYQPDWSQPARFDYTVDLIAILAGLLPEGGEGSISTLPLGWRADMPHRPAALDAAAAKLIDLVHHLARVELDTGKLIHLNLEPEPGCAFDTSATAIDFFQEHLLRNNPDEVSVRGYIRLCHDVCHAAVMFEDQAAALQRYRAAGLGVGKVQISSAVRVAFDEMTQPDRRAAADQLRGFCEDRYLHQTMVRDAAGALTFYEDLPLALAAVPDGELPRGEWRVHFHVPIYLDRLGLLRTTQAEIGQCMAAIQSRDAVHHYEVETYAWNVLPRELKRSDLADGIADELAWVMGSSAKEHRI